MHDLENKKRKSIEQLKDAGTLRFFMKVNVYDPENVQKGRLMLLNLAEDLKEYAKMSVSPASEEKKQGAKSDKKGDFAQAGSEKLAEKFVRLDNMGEKLDEDLDDEPNSDDMSSRPSYLYMELKSTSQFRDIDIDKMLEHTTLDDFMRGMYISKDGSTFRGQQKEQTGVLGGAAEQAQSEEDGMPKLYEKPTSVRDKLTQ